MNTPKTDALNKHIDAMPKTTGEWVEWAAQYAECSRQLETQVQELREALAKTIRYLEDELWISGESRQAQREVARAILARTK